MKQWTPDDSGEGDFELTPMIDVIFLLIAFFMTLISFITDELIELELPEAEQATVPEDPGERQYISIKEDGSLFFGARPVAYDELANFLADVRERQPDLKVYLRADEDTPHRHVNRVMDSAAEAGLFNMIFASNRD